LVRASGLVVDVLADREIAAPGESVHATVNSYLQEATAKITSLRLHVPDGWIVTPNPSNATDGATGTAASFRETPTQSETLSFAISDTAPFTQPYWMERKRQGDVYDWSNVDPAMKNRPFAAPIVTAELHADIGGVDVTVVRPLEY